jgi:hypothetical protein
MYSKKMVEIEDNMISCSFSVTTFFVLGVTFFQHFRTENAFVGKGFLDRQGHAADRQLKIASLDDPRTW